MQKCSKAFNGIQKYERIYDSKLKHATGMPNMPRKRED